MIRQDFRNIPKMLHLSKFVKFYILKGLLRETVCIFEILRTIVLSVIKKIGGGVLNFERGGGFQVRRT